jgi:energy-coupling factor transporter ATP-binding protein EcfA2
MAEKTSSANKKELLVEKENLNPFPGLRPFGMEESHLFFGREGQSEEVLLKLSQNKFVAVIGASGTGKSSLIYCGLVPILYGGFIATAGSQWKIIATRPGSGPIDNLAESIVKSTATNESAEFKKQQKGFYGAMLRRSSLGLIEALRQIPNPNGENILLLVDQFEELFRYRTSRKGLESLNESGAYVKLLVEIVTQSELPVFVVLTMRSDFIGECSNYQELTSLINRSNYLIPQMTRNDFNDAIHGPVAVGGATIEPALVHELLNDVGDNPDQLPILQHAMMRTWNYWLNNSDRDKALSISDYEAIGKMEKALSEHANEAFDELNDEGKRICEVLFKTITEKGTDNRGVRRPTRLEDIAHIAQTNVKEVVIVIDKFRSHGRSFITPSAEVTLSPDSIIDLSHESLMRIWNRLKVWVDEESAAVQMYLRLSEASSLYQHGQSGLWRPPDLQIALNWERKQKPTLVWAQRHNPAFERAMVFLRSSEKDYEAEEINKLKLQKRALRRSRLIAVVLGAAAMISLYMWFLSQMQKNEAEKQKKVATKNSIAANIQKRLAEQNATEAMEQKKIAVVRTQEALQQKEFADQQSEIALRNAREAEIQRIIANNNSREATVQKSLAEKNATEAIGQKSAAEKAQEEAFTRRMLSIAQSMAVKSQQLDDKEVKALLSFQAYVFNERFQGAKHNPDIYGALYASLVAQNGNFFNVYKGHTDGVNGVVFNPFTSSFFTAGSDGRIMRWESTDSIHRPVILINTRPDSKQVFKCIDVSPDGSLLAFGTLGSGIGLLELRVRDALPRYFSNMGKNILTLKFSSDGKSIIAASDSTLFEYNISNKAGYNTGNADGEILSIAISSDGKKVATGTRNGKTILWDRSNGYRKEVLIEENKNQIYAISFSKSGNLLASGNLQGYLKVWDMRDKKLIYNIRAHSARIADIKFSSDDRLLALAGFDNICSLWDASNLNVQPIKLKTDSWVMCTAFSSNNDKLVTGASRENRVVIWPTRLSEMASMVYNKIGRSFTQDEWQLYVGSDIKYEKTK